MIINSSVIHISMIKDLNTTELKFFSTYTTDMFLCKVYAKASKSITKKLFMNMNFPGVSSLVNLTASKFLSDQ